MRFPKCLHKQKLKSFYYYFIIIRLVRFTQLNYIMYSIEWFIHNMQPNAISLQLLCTCILITICTFNYNLCIIIHMSAYYVYNIYNYIYMQGHLNFYLQTFMSRDYIRFFNMSNLPLSFA